MKIDTDVIGDSKLVTKYVDKSEDDVRKMDGLSDTDSETIVSSEVLDADSSQDENASRADENCFNDVTITAGNRLYSQAVNQQKRHEERRKEALEQKQKLQLATQSEIGMKLRSVVSKKNQKLLKNRSPKTIYPETKDEVRTVDIEVLKSARVPERCNKLYQLSNNEQKLGKQRRSLIEEKQAKAKFAPETKILPISRAGDMYTRSMERLITHKLKVAALAEEVGSDRFYEQKQIANK